CPAASCACTASVYRTPGIKTEVIPVRLQAARNPRRSSVIRTPQERRTEHPFRHYTRPTALATRPGCNAGTGALASAGRSLQSGLAASGHLDQHAQAMRRHILGADRSLVQAN